MKVEFLQFRERGQLTNIFVGFSRRNKIIDDIFQFIAAES